jgi:hypothetical protein
MLVNLNNTKMNMNNNTLEPIALPFAAINNSETKSARPPAGKITLLAKWLLPPAGICASVLLVKVAMVAGDLLEIFKNLSANIPA